MCSDTLLRVKMESVNIKRIFLWIYIRQFKAKKSYFWFLHFQFLHYRQSVRVHQRHHSQYTFKLISQMMTNQKLTMCSVSESKCPYYTQKTERLAVGCLNGCSHTESWSHVKGLCCLAIINPSKLWARCLGGYIYLLRYLSLPS